MKKFNRVCLSNNYELFDIPTKSDLNWLKTDLKLGHDYTLDFDKVSEYTNRYNSEQFYEEFTESKGYLSVFGDNRKRQMEQFNWVSKKFTTKNLKFKKLKPVRKRKMESLQEIALNICKQRNLYRGLPCYLSSQVQLDRANKMFTAANNLVRVRYDGMHNFNPNQAFKDVQSVYQYAYPPAPTLIAKMNVHFHPFGTGSFDDVDMWCDNNSKIKRSKIQYELKNSICNNGKKEKRLDHSWDDDYETVSINIWERDDICEYWDFIRTGYTFLKKLSLSRSMSFIKGNHVRSAYHYIGRIFDMWCEIIVSKSFDRYEFGDDCCVIAREPATDWILRTRSNPYIDPFPEMYWNRRYSYLLPKKIMNNPYI